MNQLNKKIITGNNLQNGQNFMFKTFILLSLTVLCLIFTACSTIRLQRAQFTEDKRANLPQNIKTAEEDADIANETSCIITVNDDSGTFFIGKEQLSEARLKEKIAEKMKGKSPDKRIVYIESAVGVQYSTIVKILDLIRKNDVDKAGLIAFRKKFENTGIKPSRIEVKIPVEQSLEEVQSKKPNPLTLIVTIDKTGTLLLNNDSAGNFSDTTNLTNKLTNVFKDRESEGVFREGTNEVEKTVFIKASKTLKYGDVVKVIDAVKLAGAQPIGLQIDDLSDYE